MAVSWMDCAPPALDASDAGASLAPQADACGHPAVRKPASASLSSGSGTASTSFSAADTDRESVADTGTSGTAFADTDLESVADTVAAVYLSEELSAHTHFVNCFLRLATVPKETSLIDLIWRCVVLLKRCGFPDEDVCSVLAHASAYMATVVAAASTEGIGSEEMRLLLLVCIYSAHGFVLDSECPLRVWKQFAMDESVTLRSLNMAIVHLMKVRGYRMRVSDSSLSDRYSRLLVAASAP